MGKSIRILVSVPPDYATILADPDAEPALAGAALSELILFNHTWHVGATDMREGLVPVGVVLLLDDAHAADLLSGAAPALTLYQAASGGRILFVSGHMNPDPLPPVAPQGVSREAVERAMDSLHRFRLDQADTVRTRRARWRLASN